MKDTICLLLTAQMVLLKWPAKFEGNTLILSRLNCATDYVDAKSICSTLISGRNSIVNSVNYSPRYGLMLHGFDFVFGSIFSLSLSRPIEWRFVQKPKSIFILNEFQPLTQIYGKRNSKKKKWPHFRQYLHRTDIFSGHKNFHMINLHS